eukprot:Gregarina_sp_Poly_1__2168@NODE_1576_length_3804_cov_60_853893_g1042_i0_p1_GENE_NODE_1576_length_3804_cov_60_853893_g1042_i0NODE_1576_length_3804_cov_60_853893_g1042_i0_p1_ORF_typecomplete_len861_score120_81Sec34/PF04136_15/1_3e03Sec34/PF04136_15/0_01Sec34/PF04136_15/75_NODE_1576_length_3804_cov_60_853893_g1042_i09883570
MDSESDNELNQFLLEENIEIPQENFFAFTFFRLQKQATAALLSSATSESADSVDATDPKTLDSLWKEFVATQSSQEELPTQAKLLTQRSNSLLASSEYEKRFEKDKAAAYQELYEEFRDVWQAKEVFQSLSASVRIIDAGLRDIKHLAELGETKWTNLDSQKRASLGAKANEQIVLELLESKLEAFTIVQDELFSQIEQSTETNFILLLTSNLPKLKALLERMDQASLRLPHTHHPEAGSYVQRYDKFRVHVCTSVKSILCRTFERTEKYLLTQIQASQMALEKSIEKTEYLDRLTKVAVARESPRDNGNSESDFLGLRSTSDSAVNTFVPARWFYIKFRSYGINILPITKLLAERASVTNIPIYGEILEQLGGVYAALRIRFLLKSFERQLVYLIFQHKKSDGGLDLACRQASTFWLSIANYEIDIFRAYFGPESQRYVQASLVTILQSLGDAYCETLRPCLVGCHDFATLKDVHDCLSVDILDVESSHERQAANEQSNLNMIKFAPIHRILGDLEESLIFRIENFIAREIKDFTFNEESLNYPAVLYEAPSVEARKNVFLPTTKQTIFCLSKMRNVFNSKVLKSVANELIATTMEKLIEAVDYVDECNSHNVIDSRLFGLRESLHLRENLEFYKFDISGNVQRILSFEKLRHSIQTVFFFLSHPRQEASDPEASRFGTFISMITPELKDEEFDSKETLNYKIDEWIQDVITYITKSCIAPLITYLSTEGDLQATLDTFWNEFSSILGSYLNSIGLYLLDIPKVITKCPGVDDIDDAAPFNLNPHDGMKTKKVSINSKSDLFLEPIRIAIGEAYRQFVKVVQSKDPALIGSSMFFSVHRVDNLIRFYFSHFNETTAGMH